MSNTYNEMIDSAAAMVDRRTARGFNWSDSRTLLAELCSEHTGDNLVSALVYHEFATEKQAASYVDQYVGGRTGGTR